MNRLSSDELVQRPPFFSRRVLLLIIGILILGGGLIFADWWTCLPQQTQASYVGRPSCIQCHQSQAKRWTGSHHDKAMDLATEETVLGDFNDAELTHHGITSKMYRRDGLFWVQTEGPDGSLMEFQVRYVFGVEPLQQYMVEFDRPDGLNAHEVPRLQILPVVWDTRQKRWFFLQPPDVEEKIEPDDDLHWTGISQRWNNMCADCHSTDVSKNFNVAERTYATTFSEIDVSCEACHGPGSVHVELANKVSLFWDRKQGYGLAKLKGPDPKPQIHTCAPCHSRRRKLTDSFRPGDNYYDHFANELLHSHTYHADGQILDEVYVHGSFVQSKMYQKGIRCTDCHDPHTTKIKFTGNQLCTFCHQHSAGKYDSPAHHHHKSDSTGSLCVECHMPATTYMAVDPRRDHSLRVPRPDLSVDLNTPNACTGCHLKPENLTQEKRDRLGEYADWLRAAREGDTEVRDELARLDLWALTTVEQWYGKKDHKKRHFAYALAGAWKGEPQAEQELIQVVEDKQTPAIVRASALFQLGQYRSRDSLIASRRALKDRAPQVRAAAIGNLEALSDKEMLETLVPLLKDPVRLVRAQAGRALARIPGYLLSGKQRRKRTAALDEWKLGLEINNDAGRAHAVLGSLYESLGEVDQAEQAYRQSISIHDTIPGPRRNLAAMYSRRAQAQGAAARQAIASGRRAEAQRLAKEADRLGQQAIELRKEELQLLARDAKLAPNNAAIQYEYGLLLALHEQVEEAGEALKTACRLAPNSPDFLLALTYYYQKYQLWDKALEGVQKLIRMRPKQRAYQYLLQEIRSQAGASR